MKTFSLRSLIKVCFFSAVLSQILAPASSAQPVSARAILGTNIVSINVATNQRFELLSLEPAASYGYMDVSTTTQTAFSKSTNRTVNPSPAWSILYSSPALTISSDTRKTNVTTGDSPSVLATNVYVGRKTMPEFIVGPATLRITPQTNASYMLNYRLRANN